MQRPSAPRTAQHTATKSSVHNANVYDIGLLYTQPRIKSRTIQKRFSYSNYSSVEKYLALLLHIFEQTLKQIEISIPPERPVVIGHVILRCNLRNYSVSCWTGSVFLSISKHNTYWPTKSVNLSLPCSLKQVTLRYIGL